MEVNKLFFHELQLPIFKNIGLKDILKRFKVSQKQSINIDNNTDSNNIWFGFMSENHKKIFHSFENLLDVPFGCFSIKEENDKLKFTNLINKISYVFEYFKAKSLNSNHLGDLVGFYGYRSITLTEGFNNFLDLTKASVIILFKGENYQAKIIGEICAKRGVRTIAIQHGLLGSDKKLYRNLTIDEYWVWGELFKARLSESGIKKIVIVGNPKTDELFLSAKKSRKENRITKSILGLPNSGSSITNFENVKLLINSILEFGRKKPSLEIGIKPHPADFGNNVLNYIGQNASISNLNNLKVFSREISPPYANFDIVIINNSTTGLESAIFGLPLIIVGAKIEDCLVPQYLENGGAIFATNFDEFEDAYNKICSDYKHFSLQIKMMLDNQVSFQGFGSQTIANMINELN